MGVLCATRQVGRTRSSHPESALRSPSHAPLPRARGGNTGGARAFCSPRGHVKSAAGHPEPALSRPGDELDLATATVSGSAVLQQLALSPSSPSPRLSYALHGSPHGSQAPSSPQPLAGTRTPLGPPIEGNPLHASDSPPTAHALPISLVVPLKPPSLWAPASPAGLRVSPPRRPPAHDHQPWPSLGHHFYVTTTAPRAPVARQALFSESEALEVETQQRCSLPQQGKNHLENFRTNTGHDKHLDESRSY